MRSTASPYVRTYGVLGSEDDVQSTARWLDSRAPWRDRDWDGGPLTPQQKGEKPRRIVAAELYLGAPDESGCPQAIGLGLYGGSCVVYLALGKPDEDWQRLV